jgi:RNA polymerase-binding transcription factor DksA
VLQALRRRLEGERLARQAEAAAPLEGHGAHVADSATDEFDHDLALTLLAREEDALAQVTAALERIRAGAYGRCLATGAPIPAERLRAVPWCRYTREVESAQEAQRAHPARLHLSPVHSLRAGVTRIPGAGDVPREGEEHEPKPPEEPKAGPAIDEGARPGDEGPERDDA